MNVGLAAIKCLRLACKHSDELVEKHGERGTYSALRSIVDLSTVVQKMADRNVSRRGKKPFPNSASPRLLFP